MTQNASHTQRELFPVSELSPVLHEQPRTVPEAIAAGHKMPLGANPFLWSSNLWEAFNIGQYLAKRGISPDGFRKSRGSRYVNNAGLVLKYHYDAAGWFLEAGAFPATLDKMCPFVESEPLCPRGVFTSQAHERHCTHVSHIFHVHPQPRSP